MPANAAVVPAASTSARPVAPHGSRSSSESCHDADAAENRCAERAEKATPLNLLASLPASPAISRVPKRPRENSVVALYKAMVEPHIQIDMQAPTVTPLKGKVASAKKFRRSSMLKQAAAIRSPAVAAALTKQPVVSSASKPGVIPASPQAAQKVVKDMGTPEMLMKVSTSAASSAAVPGRAAGQMPADTAVVQPTAATGQLAVAEGAQEVKKPPKKAAMPPVPVFPPRPKEVPIALPPKLDEDNYEISEKDENSDEACEEPDRSHKHVPRWCSNYLETLATQSSLDPDSIFGNKVPRCDLDAIFLMRSTRSTVDSVH